MLKKKQQLKSQIIWLLISLCISLKTGFLLLLSCPVWKINRWILVTNVYKKNFKKSLAFYYASLLNSSVGNVPVVKACSLNKNVFHATIPWSKLSIYGHK